MQVFIFKKILSKKFSQYTGLMLICLFRMFVFCFLRMILCGRLASDSLELLILLPHLSATTVVVFYTIQRLSSIPWICWVVNAMDREGQDEQALMFTEGNCQSPRHHPRSPRGTSCYYTPPWDCIHLSRRKGRINKTVRLLTGYHRSHRTVYLLLI